jgi:ATP synthase protein I
MTRVTPTRATLAVGGASALVAWAGVGIEGLLGGVIATLLVVVFFASGSVPLVLAGQAGLRAGAGVALLLLTYVLRLVLALAVLVVAASSDRVDPAALGVTLIVCALTWSGLQVLAVVGADRST